MIDLIENPEAIQWPTFDAVGMMFDFSTWVPADFIFSPPGSKTVNWKPEPSWISKRLLVKRVLPDAKMVRGMFGKLAVASNSFSDQVGGGSLTGWQENDDIKGIWERAYRNLTTGTFNSLWLRNRITKAREEMAKREEGRGRTQPDKTVADYPDFPRGVLQPLRNSR
jgi:hypothetical protein